MRRKNIKKVIQEFGRQLENEPRWITVQDASNLYGCSVRNIYYKIDQFDTIKFGGRRLVCKYSILAQGLKERVIEYNSLSDEDKQQISNK